MPPVEFSGESRDGEELVAVPNDPRRDTMASLSPEVHNDDDADGLSAVAGLFPRLTAPKMRVATEVYPSPIVGLGHTSAVL